MVDDEQIAQFTAVTGCDDASKARFFLESASGDVAAAVNAFFEHGDAPLPANPASDPAPDPAPEDPAPARAPTAATAAPPPRRAGGSSRRAAASNVRGFGDLGAGGDSDEDDDDKPQEWYTGGAQSGSVVQDPKKPKNPPEGRTTEQILDAAREAGAVQGAAEDLDPRAAAGGSRAGRTHAAAFTGGGRRLGDAADEPAGGSSDPSPDAAAAAAAPGSAAPPPPPAPVAHTIAFYANGFVVDDGPLRALDDPANIPFMNAIAKGECPRELLPPRPDTPININLVRKDGDYEPPPEPKYVAFGGSGRTLGGEGAGGSSKGKGAADGDEGSGGVGGGSASAAAEWVIDDSAPSASIQLRLRNGTRMVAKFNLTHTVADVRAFIAKVGAAGDGAYTLQLAGFPPEQLTDETRAVGDGLANAVVIQR